MLTFRPVACPTYDTISNLMSTVFHRWPEATWITSTCAAGLALARSQRVAPSLPVPCAACLLSTNTNAHSPMVAIFVAKTERHIESCSKALVPSPRTCEGGGGSEGASSAMFAARDSSQPSSRFHSSNASVKPHSQSTCSGALWSSTPVWLSHGSANRSVVVHPCSDDSPRMHAQTSEIARNLSSEL